MDEMKITISSEPLRNLAALIVSKAVKKKLGYEVAVQLNEFTATHTNGISHVHLSIDAELNQEEFTKIIGKLKGKIKGKIMGNTEA